METTTEVQEKRKPGRPKGTVKKINLIDEPLNTTENLTGNEDEIEKLLSGYTKQVEIEPEKINTETEVKNKLGRPVGSTKKTSEKTINNTPLITGALLMVLIDIGIPSLIVLINNKVSKKKVKIVNLQLSEVEKQSLIPIADEAAKELNLHANPVTLLIISLIAMYSTKLLMLKQ